MKKKLEELEKENKEKIEKKKAKDTDILVPKLRALRSPDAAKLWTSPYFGVSFSMKF